MTNTYNPNVDDCIIVGTEPSRSYVIGQIGIHNLLAILVVWDGTQWMPFSRFVNRYGLAKNLLGVNVQEYAKEDLNQAYDRAMRIL